MSTTDGWAKNNRVKVRDLRSAEVNFARQRLLAPDPGMRGANLEIPQIVANTVINLIFKFRLRCHIKHAPCGRFATQTIRDPT